MRKYSLWILLSLALSSVVQAGGRVGSIEVGVQGVSVSFTPDGESTFSAKVCDLLPSKDLLLQLLISAGVSKKLTDLKFRKENESVCIYSANVDYRTRAQARFVNED